MLRALMAGELDVRRTDVGPAPAAAPDTGGLGPTHDGEPGALPRKPMAALFCAALLAATIMPVAQNWSARPVDGFPFSYYPMFSQPIGETYRVTHVVGIDREGREHVVPFRYLGDGGLNQVRATVQRAAHDDPQRFCRQVAEAVRARPSPALQDVDELVVRTGRYAIESFYAGRIEARSQREHARCRIER